MPTLVLFSPIQSISVLFSPLWSYSVHFGLIILFPFGLIWSYSIYFDSIRSTLVHFGLNQSIISTLVLFNPLWFYSVHFDHIRSTSVSFDSIWSYSVLFSQLQSYSRPALGLSHLGHCLGPPTRERPPNFGAKLIYLFGDIGKKKFYIFFLLLRSHKELIWQLIWFVYVNNLLNTFLNYFL